MNQLLPDPFADDIPVEQSETAVPAFARLIDVMGPIRDSGMRIAEFLGETAAGMASGQHDLTGAARQARSALTPIADTDAMARRLSQANQARSVLEALRSRAVALRAIASLSKLTARSMGSDRFDDYTEKLGSKSSDLGQTAERVWLTLAEVSDHISSAARAAQDALTALDVMLEAVTDTPGTPPSSEAQTLRLQGLADAAGALQERLRADLNGLVALMQFSDAYRQRMEHIETLAARTNVAALARAQLEALAEDTQDAILETQDRVERLTALATEAAGQFREDGMASDALREASLQHAALDTAVQQAASVSRAANVVREGADVLQRSMQVAREALSALQDQSEDIGLSAINSLLLARGDEQTSRAMSNLAAAVGEHARHTSAELAQCKSLMEHLTRGSDTMADAVVTHAETLETILAGARTALQAENARAASRQVGETTALQSVTCLEAALADATLALDALRPVPDHLLARAQGLGPPGELPDRAAADAMRGIYTMQRERDVHDTLLGVTPETETATNTAEEQDLDDIFF